MVALGHRLRTVTGGFAVLYLHIALSSGFILQSFIYTDDVYRCPETLLWDDHVRAFQDRCYEFVTYKEHYWTDARHDCNSRGGDLVIVDSSDKQAFVMAVLRELNVKNPGIWLGLEDRQHELHWQWINGEPLSSGYRHWSHKQGHGLLHYTQDCAMIRMDDGGLWHDRECHLWPNRFPYICQYALSSGFILQSFIYTDDVYRCPETLLWDDHVRAFQDRCYEFVTYKEHYWTDARHDCNSRGGDLVIVDSSDKQAFVMAVLRELNVKNPGIWLGLEDRQHELHWQWINGEPLSSGYRHWSHKQGHGLLHYTQDCAMIRMDDGGLWHDRECHLWPNRFPYICQYDLKPPTTTRKTTPAVPKSTTTSSTTSSTTTYSTVTVSTAKTTATTTTAPTALTAKTTTTTASTPLTSKLTSALRTSLTSTGASIATTLETDSPTTRAIAELFTSTLTSSTSTTTKLMTSSKVALTSLSSTISVVDELSTHLKTPAATATPTEHTVSVTPQPSRQTTTTICTEINCQKECPSGYAGIYVGIDGCIKCHCNGG